MSKWSPLTSTENPPTDKEAVIQIADWLERQWPYLEFDETNAAADQLRLIGLRIERGGNKCNF